MTLIGITVKFKDEDRADRHFSGSRYKTISVEYQGGFAIVHDGQGKTVSFPSADILEIETSSL